MFKAFKPVWAIACMLALCACSEGGGSDGQAAGQAAGPPGAPAGSVPPRASTARPNVAVLAPLAMASLDRRRTVRLYLPPGYAQSGRRYPVIYMHDAQNLFDAATAYAGEWEVDETLDATAAAGTLEAIVVGIDNGGEHRMQEMNPWDNPRFGTGEGGAYLDFVVGVVKPMIDAGYRTLPDRANTAIVGSSMGGFISHYAIDRYPEVFGKAGVFSPSYWVNDRKMFDDVAAHPAARDARIYLLMGADEGDTMVPDVRRMQAHLLASGHPAANLRLKIVPGGSHNEALWRGELREALTWMFER